MGKKNLEVNCVITTLFLLKSHITVIKIVIKILLVISNHIIINIK